MPACDQLSATEAIIRALKLKKYFPVLTPNRGIRDDPGQDQNPGLQFWLRNCILPIFPLTLQYYRVGMRSSWTLPGYLSSLLPPPETFWRNFGRARPSPRCFNSDTESPCNKGKVSTKCKQCSFAEQSITRTTGQLRIIIHSCKQE